MFYIIHRVRILLQQRTANPRLTHDEYGKTDRDMTVHTFHSTLFTDILISNFISTTAYQIFPFCV